MLKIGSECLKEGRNAVAGLSQKEIYRKIKDESKEEVKKLELDLVVQREMAKQMEEKISKIYEGQVEQLKKQMEMMRQQIKSYESENKDLIEKEVNKAREKYDLLLKEKDKQNQLNREAVEKLQESVIKLTNEEKSNNKKGREGEKEFSDYAETFKDFQSFQIIDKHTQGGQGDFHLHFEDFDILVDAKNYKKKVPIDQREKIKNDLLKNEHINFAWLVSLNTMIDKWDKSPIMYEWINTSQCIVYINNLSTFEEPQKILRIVWFTCKELYKLIEDGTADIAELSELKNKQFKLMDKIKEIRKNIRELNTTINNTRNIVQLMDEQLRDILESESSNIINSSFSLFDEWWDENIIVTNDEKIELSTNLWMRFKQDNKTLVKEMEISVDKFKQFIKSKVPLSSLYLKNKNANSAFDIKGILLKSEKVKTSEETIVGESIEIELVEDVIKPKKIKKIISKEYYFDEVVDKKIIEHYNDKKNDIMILSETFTLRPWQIVSVLMKHKIIEKREDSRGYDKYKKTEEYKSKIEK
ncbi:MAG: hypothetical protein EB114_12495 [Betaproteobacteria bacterium]|nr:hypothetical protein [Betaproteobacteria bacterium]